jgi:transposase InsO family protein
MGRQLPADPGAHGDGTGDRHPSPPHPPIAGRLLDPLTQDRPVHLDVKQLGRIPDGGGHRIHGRAATTPGGLGIGYDYIHSAVDDRSRVAFSQILPDESAATAALLLIEAASFFADHGVQIQRVLTDNAKAYTQSILFAETAAGLGITLKRTRRYRPQTNGKVGRFNKTLLEEWAYRRLYRSNTERRRAFRRWLRFYNHRRPHTSLDGLTPMAVLINNPHKNYS